MQTFDYSYVDDLIRRLEALEPDSRPDDGRTSGGRMVAHLADAVRYTMGRAAVPAHNGSFFRRRIAGPLMMNGLLMLPRSLLRRIPDHNGDVPPGESADVETLHAVLDEYLGLVHTGELAPAPHPVFGDIGVDGWARLHVSHIEHHLGQFGL